MTNTTAIKLANSLNKNVAERIAYEDSKRVEDENSNVVSHIMKAFAVDYKTMKTKHTIAYFQALVDANFLQDFDFINNSVKSTSRFNVYAIKKAALKIDSVAQNKLLRVTALDNKFCVAAVLSCLQNKDAESFTFTRSHALAMLSKALRFEHVATSDLATKFDVAASTASTQVSSSFRVLEALSILTFDDSDKARSTVSNFNKDNAFVHLIAANYKIAL
jgi:hypothetical protein